MYKKSFKARGSTQPIFFFPFFYIFPSCVCHLILFLLLHIHKTTRQSRNDAQQFGAANALDFTIKSGNNQAKEPLVYFSCCLRETLILKQMENIPSESHSAFIDLGRFLPFCL